MQQQSSPQSSSTITYTTTSADKKHYCLLFCYISFKGNPSLDSHFKCNATLVKGKWLTVSLTVCLHCFCRWTGICAVECHHKSVTADIRKIFISIALKQPECVMATGSGVMLLARIKGVMLTVKPAYTPRGAVTNCTVSDCPACIYICILKSRYLLH